jgi:hypothetical protein
MQTKALILVALASVAEISFAQGKNKADSVTGINVVMLQGGGAQVTWKSIDKAWLPGPQ